MTTPLEVIDAAIDGVRYFSHQTWKTLEGLCESPIEEIFLAAVYGSNIDKQYAPVHIYGGQYSPDKELFDGDHLWTQARVGIYRLDFLFAHVTPSGERTLVAVECDGHDFHEKTKQQAAKDKARDRFLVGQGIKVLRFTGSEIYNDPFACWAETFNVLWNGK